MRKINKPLIWIVLLMLLLAPLATAASTAGSAADPLVSKSWVDEYVQQQFAPLEDRLSRLRQLAAAGDSVDIVLTIGSPVVQVNGASQTIDVAPKIAGSGYTLVPIRFVAEALGVDVEWLPETRQVRFTSGVKEILLTVGSTTAYINGEPYAVAYPPVIDNSLSEGRTLVHIRFVGEAFGCALDWEPKGASTKYVYISR